MIIGITGTLGAGKGTVVDFLKEKGFRHFSVRDYLIKILNFIRPSFKLIKNNNGFSILM